MWHDDESIDLILILLADDAPSPWTNIGRGYHISPSGLSPSCVSLVRQWLSLCTAAKGKHSNCTTPEVPLLPTRVVLVGDSSTPPRLYLTTPGEKGRYAALSHCWGGNVPSRTLLSNLEDHIVSLPDNLPQTFKDAISVVRALEIKFLWIDSLCIIQDSMDDWRAESANMAHVYANAHITIAADAAADSFSGFLTAPSRQVPPQKSICYNDGQGVSSHPGPGVIHVRKRGFLAEELPFHCWASPDKTSGRSKLSTRGWVFQERLLSPRTVHFSEHEMAWECRSLCNCECSAMSLRTLRTTSVIKHFLYPRQLDLPAFEASWRNEIIPAYTRLNLTVQTDRLPALAGLSQAAERLRAGDQFLAGLWRKTLAVDALWCTISSRESRRYPTEYAPTWSWASITGAIRHGASDLEEKDCSFSVLDIRFDGSAPNLLIGNCPAIPVTVSRPWSEIDSQAQPLFGPADINLAVIWDCCYDDRQEPESESTRYFFLVFGTRREGNGPFGLLVVRSSGDGKLPGRFFNRVGFVDGFRRATRLRRWGSSGWNEHDEEDGGGLDMEEKQPRLNTDRKAWVAEVLGTMRRRVDIL
jgi:hypothetical protein